MRSQAKMYPVGPPEFAVRRPRLESLLDQGARRRLTVVAASAGYGKSVLLGQWAATRLAGPVAWLTVDERDADPNRLGARLVGAIAGVRPGAGERALAALGGATSRLGDEFVDLLLDDLASSDDDLVVVLDDVDRLEGPSIDDLARLIAEAPPHVHVTLTCRADPSFSTHRWRSRGELLEVRVGDLRFNAAEVQQVAERVGGRRLTDDQVAHILDLTEGWPVAVELVALSLRGVDDPTEVLAFAGTDRTIVDYLCAEVLDREPPELHSFLLDISVLEEMSGELADAVTGRSDGGRLLATLERRGLFVERVPGEAGWYRLHRLVRELLRHDLRSADPGRPALLLGRAADWWLDRDEPAPAGSCLIAARAWDRLIELVYTHGRAAWDHGAAAAVLSWIDAIPAPIRREDARLRLIQAALELVVGHGARAAVAVRELEHEVDLTPGEQVLADTVMCSIVTVSGPQDDTLERAARALAALREAPDTEMPDLLVVTDVHGVRAMVATMAARARLLLGDGAALDDAELSLGSPEQTATVSRVNAIGTAALLEALAGRVERAASLATLAEDLAHGTLSEDHPGSLFWRIALVVIARMRDDLDTAAERAETALAVATRWRRWPWIAFLLGEEAMIALGRGETSTARDHVRRCAQLPVPDVGPMVEGRLRSIELRAAAMARGADRVAVEPEAVGTSWELAAAAVTTALGRGEVGSARKHLELWPASAAPLGEVEHELCLALVDAAEGSVEAAAARVTALLRRTDRDGVVRPYLDAGEPAIALLELAARQAPSDHLDLVLGRARRVGVGRVALVDPLSERELEVLRYLPTRMGNAEIARALFVSTNTIKTHVKHIYQKLGATSRDDAVRVAKQIGLL